MSCSAVSRPLVANTFDLETDAGRAAFTVAAILALGTVIGSPLVKKAQTAT
jgi:hypothetical protein